MSEAHKMAETVTMYRLSRWRTNAVEQVDVVKMTEHFVTFIERDFGKPHERRERHDGKYFQTWEEAHVAITQRAEERVSHLRTALDRARSELDLVKKMRKPT